MQKTTKEYWDSLWTDQRSVPLLQPDSDAVLRQFDRAFHQFIRTSFEEWGEQPRTLLELGCGASPYLPYFAEYHQLAVSGLDYSETGCERAHQLLCGRGCEGTIVRGDMFDPPPELKGKFDVVFSLGLLEHFTETAVAIRAATAFVRPGGLIISVIPNMTALTGWLQRVIDPPTYALHVPMDRATFAQAHAAAGVTLLSSGYLMTANPYVIHYPDEDSAKGLVIRIVRGVLARSWWWVERKIGTSYPNRITSPYVVCAGRFQTGEAL